MKAGGSELLGKTSTGARSDVHSRSAWSVDVGHGDVTTRYTYQKFRTNKHSIEITFITIYFNRRRGYSFQITVHTMHWCGHHFFIIFEIDYVQPARTFLFSEHSTWPFTVNAAYTTSFVHIECILKFSQKVTSKATLESTVTAST